MNENGIEELIGTLYEMVQDAKSVPFSGDKCSIERERVLDLLDEISNQLPGELKQAKTIVDSRSELITSAKREAENILKAYQTLLNCRGGADLHKETKTKVIKASCNGILQPNGEKYDFGLVKDLFAEELKKEGFAVKGVGINGKDITKKMLENEDEAKVAEMKKFIVPGTL